MTRLYRDKSGRLRGMSLALRDILRTRPEITTVELCALLPEYTAKSVERTLHRWRDAGAVVSRRVWLTQPKPHYASRWTALPALDTMRGIGRGGDPVVVPDDSPEDAAWVPPVYVPALRARRFAQREVVVLPLDFADPLRRAA
jgi:hypothetical protein